MNEMRTCKYGPCGTEFAPVKNNQLFCCPEHKAAWHREQPFKNGVLVEITTSRTNRRHLSANVKMALEDQERFAKMNTQGMKVYLVPMPEGSD